MEEKVSTKKRIVFEALKLFSEKGYDGVSMREIAAAVGIKGASLYNHFAGKEDIFGAIFDEMKQQYEAASTAMSIPSENGEQTISLYHSIGEEQLLQMAEGLFSFFAKNEFVAMFRRMLTSEQFKSKLASECYKQYYLETPIAFQSSVFAGLQQGGDFSGYEPEALALAFFSPILYILNLYDLGCPYDECLKKLNSHIKSFCKGYVK